MEERRFRIEAVSQNLSQVFQAVDREELVIIERGPAAPDLVLMTRRQFDELKAQRNPGSTPMTEMDSGSTTEAQRNTG